MSIRTSFYNTVPVHYFSSKYYVRFAIDMVLLQNFTAEFLIGQEYRIHVAVRCVGGGG